MDNLAKKTKFSIKQLTAIEKIASDPGYPTVKLASELSIIPGTLRTWKNDINFISAVYDRFMDIAGKHMPDVILAQIREAKEGNTQAATLVLKHFGKFQDTITVKIEAPFNQFLKNKDIEDIEDAEMVPEEAVEIGNSFELPEATLPPRNPENDNPRYVKSKQTQKLNKTYKRKRYLDNRTERYRWLTRAKAVGVDPLPRGRPTEEVLRKWHRSIVRAEAQEDFT